MLVKLFLSFFARYILTEQKSFKALDLLNDLLIFEKERNVKVFGPLTISWF